MVKLPTIPNTIFTVTNSLDLGCLKDKTSILFFPEPDPVAENTEVVETKILES
jgi:hypothetical protein